MYSLLIDIIDENFRAFARKGTAPAGPANAPLPLIHYDDAASLVCRAVVDPAPPPVPRSDLRVPVGEYAAMHRFSGFARP